MDENAKSQTQMDNILSYVYSHLKDPGIDVESVLTIADCSC